MEYLTLGMVWVLSGLFVLFLIKKVDEHKSKLYGRGYWFKNRSQSQKKLLIIFLIAIAPITLVIGIIAMVHLFDEG